MCLQIFFSHRHLSLIVIFKTQSPSLIPASAMRGGVFKIASREPGRRTVSGCTVYFEFIAWHGLQPNRNIKPRF